MLEQFFFNLWQIFLDLSPSLLLGLAIAGLLYAYLPTNFIHNGISQPNLSSVWKAALFGVPMPLCSCGVLPTALALRNEGASKGATVAFLISTPQTGVDSILVSASLLGLPFAIFKVIAAFVTGLLGGILVNKFTLHVEHSVPIISRNAVIETHYQRLRRAWRYALFDLLGAIDLWILGGILAAALITTLLPPDYFANQAWSQGGLGMLAVLLISIPLYVCTTGSIPIAASLIAAGMPTGTALVFLMAGPATNLATIGGVYRVLGAQVLVIYLSIVISMSILFGLGFDFVLSKTVPITMQHGHTPSLIAMISTVFIVGILLFLEGRRLQQRFSNQANLSMSNLSMSNLSRSNLSIKVVGMSCNHCTNRVQATLESFEAVESAIPDLATGIVQIQGENLDPQSLIQAVEQVGYKASL
ncbi:membrane protein [Achromatium sp. WMS3]|nr:membrane protein [Achromatium sp. WMS3]